MSRYINTPEYFPAVKYHQLYKSDKIETFDKSELKIKMACKILEIEDDVNKLKDSFELLNKIVTEQHSHIDTLEEHIINTKQYVKEAEEDIKIAETYSYSSYLWYIGGLALGSLAYFGYSSNKN